MGVFNTPPPKTELKVVEPMQKQEVEDSNNVKDDDVCSKANVSQDAGDKPAQDVEAVLEKVRYLFSNFS